MAVGPVQLLVLGFEHPNFQGEIRHELNRLCDNDLVREDQAAFGAPVGGLIGLGAACEAGLEIGTERGGVLSQDTAWDVLEEIPADTAGRLVLLEHRWAIPLRDAIARAGGFRLASEFISPLDLVGLGLVKGGGGRSAGVGRGRRALNKGGPAMLGPTGRVARRTVAATVVTTAPAVAVAAAAGPTGFGTARGTADRTQGGPPPRLLTAPARSRQGAREGEREGSFRGA